MNADEASSQEFQLAFDLENANGDIANLLNELEVDREGAVELPKRRPKSG